MYMYTLYTYILYDIIRICIKIYKTKFAGPLAQCVSDLRHELSSFILFILRIFPSSFDPFN